MVSAPQPVVFFVTIFNSLLYELLYLEARFVLACFFITLTH